MLEFVLFVMIIVVGTGGELCLGRAMKQGEELERLHPGHAASLLWRALRQKWLWIGVAMMAVAFFSLLLLLSFEEVSFVVPVTALSYLSVRWAGYSSSANGSLYSGGSEYCWSVWGSRWCCWQNNRAPVIAT